MIPAPAELERALIARVRDRVAAAGGRFDPAAVERIVREVLARLAAAGVDTAAPAPAAPAAPDAAGGPAATLGVYVVEFGTDPAAGRALRAAVEQAAARLGGRLLGWHEQPLASSDSD